MARGDQQLKFRVPEELKQMLTEAAELNHRSLNAEIVARLAMSFPNPAVERIARTINLRRQEESISGALAEMSDRLKEIQEELSRLQETK